MRSTVTLDPDVESLLRQRMRERGLSFNEAINQALRIGMSARSGAEGKHYVLPTFHMGFRPEVPLDRALALAAELEDQETARKLSLHK
jgi:hypothetical protein